MADGKIRQIQERRLTLNRIVVDYEKLRAHIVEKMQFYAKKADEALWNDDDYNCCEFAQYEGFHQAYSDMLWDLINIPFEEV